jgi:hypothetical protein
MTMLTPAVGEAGVIAVQWSGPSLEAYETAMEEVESGAVVGHIPDTDAYQGCRWVSPGSDFNFCTGFWNQGLSAGGSPFTELDTLDGLLDVGFGMDFYQSRPFEIFPSCQPGVFEPCYTEFTPLQLDWDYGGRGGSPFVWLSSNGGVLVVGPDWDGQFHGDEWRDIAWMEGVYGCEYFGEYWNDVRISCGESIDPFIYGLTIRIPDPVPAPPPLALVGAGLAAMCVRARRRR